MITHFANLDHYPHLHMGERLAGLLKPLLPPPVR
jgi:hypothetical protein